MASTFHAPTFHAPKVWMPLFSRRRARRWGEWIGWRDDYTCHQKRQRRRLQMMASTARRFFSVESICVDPVKECEFFSRLKRRNRTSKLMRPSRFAGLEAEIGSSIGGDGALFELGPDGKFNVKVRVGKGSEVEQLILANKTCAAGSTS